MIKVEKYEGGSPDMRDILDVFVFFSCRVCGRGCQEMFPGKSRLLGIFRGVVLAIIKRMWRVIVWQPFFLTTIFLQARHII